MDITSPNSLWKDYDIAALPLNTTELSEKTENGLIIREYYFDGFTACDGKARAYMRVIVNPNAEAVLLFLPDSDGNGTDKTVETFYNAGYTVAKLDYLGKSDDRARFTLYPPSLAVCNRRYERKFDVDEETETDHWFVWTYIARRAVLLLKNLYEGKSLFALGVGLGGSTVYKLSVFEDGIDACATLKNIIPDVSGSGNTIINYHASLDNSAYAPLCKVPLFIGVASNAEDGSVTAMSDLAKNTQSLECFRIKERAFSAGVYSLLPEIVSFFKYKHGDLPVPEIIASNSDKNLYFNIILDRTADINFSVEMYVSFCVECEQYRNWMKIPLISLGDGKYMAHINVCQSEKPIYAFANLSSETGEIRSSTVLEIIPKSLGVIGKPGIAHRKIYDGSMGLDCWTTSDGGSVSLEKGPFGIDGITCDSHSLVTFKPGDPLFKVPSDILLQLMVCGKPQTVTVSVHDKDNTYNSKIDITDSENWHKFSLAHNNFKGENGTLPDWSQIMMLDFSFEDHFVIGSVLWV